MPELCNGVDDDCNGLIDDGVLSLKQESFGEHATVAVAGNHYVVTRMLSNDVRVETYDTVGNRTGRFDDTPRLDAGSAFVESSGWDGRVVIGYGKHEFFVLDVTVDDDGIPVILDQVRLHTLWDQGDLLGIFNPPFHPRVSAFPARFVGFSNVRTFSMTPLGDAPTTEAAATPITVDSSLFLAVFDVAGTYATWEQQGNVRAGWLMEDGTFSVALDVGRGGRPSISVRDGGPGVAFIQDFRLRLSELNGFTLQCEADRFCDAPVDIDDFRLSGSTALALGYLDSAGAWLIAFDDRLFVVGRVDGQPVVQQSWDSAIGGMLPNRVDVESRGSTAAVMQSSEEGDSVLSFVGCF